MLQEASGEEETGQKAEASKHDIPIQETASEEEKKERGADQDRNKGGCTCTFEHLCPLCGADGNYL